MKEVWSHHLFDLANQSITVGRVFILALALTLLFFVYRFVLRKYFPDSFMGVPLEIAKKKVLVKLLRGLVFLSFILAAVITFKQNHILYSFESFDLTVLTIVKALLFFLSIRLVFWFVSNVVINNCLLYTSPSPRD